MFLGRQTRRFVFIGLSFNVVVAWFRVAILNEVVVLGFDDGKIGLIPPAEDLKFLLDCISMVFQDADCRSGRELWVAFGGGVEEESDGTGNFRSDIFFIRASSLH